MIGNIHINGVIGELGETPYVELSDVISQVQNQLKQGAERIVVNINSVGGDCNVGHAIAEYLESISVPVDTIATQKCCSMGSRIFMIGQTRTLIDPVDFLIHNPWTSGVQGDASYLESAANELRGEEDKLIGIYSKVTGISKEGVSALMKEDKPMSAQKALELGFATHIKQQLKAVAVLKKETMEDNKKNVLIKALDDCFTAVKKAFGSENPTSKTLETKGMMVKDDQGKSFEIWNPDGTEATEVTTGSIVMVDGQPAPDGTYTLTELGISMEVLMGVVTAVNPIEAAAAPQTPDTSALEKEIEELKAALENEKKNSQLVEEKADKAITALRALTSKHEPDTQKDFSSRNLKAVSIAEEAKKRSETYKNKK